MADNFNDNMKKRKARLDKLIEDKVADTGSDSDPDSPKTKVRNVVAAGLQAANELFVPETKTDAALMVAGPALGAVAKMRKAGKAAEAVSDYKNIGRTRNLTAAQKKIMAGAEGREAKRLGLDSADELPRNIDARERAAKKSLAEKIRAGEARGRAEQIGKPSMRQEETALRESSAQAKLNKNSDYNKEVAAKKRRKTDETEIGNEEVTK